VLGLRNKSSKVGRVSGCRFLVTLYYAAFSSNATGIMNEARRGPLDVKTTRMLLLRANHLGDRYRCGSRILSHVPSYVSSSVDFPRHHTAPV